MELYGTGTICEAALNRRGLNLEGINALDLRTKKPDGSPWDFRKREDRDLAIHLVETQRPLVVIGSPPCTAFSSWNVIMNYARMPLHKVDELLDEGKLHLRFMVQFYTIQYDNNYFSLTNIHHVLLAGAMSICRRCSL